jgi:acetyl esterase/lipase
MFLDAELAAALETSVALRDDGSEIDWVGRRALVAERRTPEPLVPSGRVGSEDLGLPRPDGSTLAVRLYRPRHERGPFGALVYFHGGAFAVGDLEAEHAVCELYCARAGCAVVSVDYRLAPEHPFPAGFEDGRTALAFAAEHAAELDLDAARLGVGGASAGGALAAGLAQSARDAGGPPLVLQFLVYPVIDDRLSTASMQLDTPVFFRRAAESMWRNYLAGLEGEPPPYAAPGRADDLAGLPPAYVLTAEHDPLRDEAIDYARRLLAAGVSVELHNYAGAVHGFDLYAPGSALTTRSFEERSARLRAALGPRSA